MFSAELYRQDCRWKMEDIKDDKRDYIAAEKIPTIKRAIGVSLYVTGRYVRECWFWKITIKS